MGMVHGCELDGSAILTEPQKPAISDSFDLQTLDQLLSATPEQLATCDIARVNLLCAAGMPDTMGLRIEDCIATLDEWTVRVAGDTSRLMYQFRRDPADFQNSEAYFRALVMITVLQRDLGVRYDASSIGKREFASSREGFIHGLLTGDRAGTCASMPVLYAAVGRRLGYPIRLSRANGHLFCRWDSGDQRERFNIEASGRGLATFPDEHYLTWPRPIPPPIACAGLFLKNLNPVEELALFLNTRGACLCDTRHYFDAIVAYAQAHRTDPADPSHMGGLMNAINAELRARSSDNPPGRRDIYLMPGLLPLGIPFRGNEQS